MREKKLARFSRRLAALCLGLLLVGPPLTARAEDESPPAEPDAVLSEPVTAVTPTPEPTAEPTPAPTAEPTPETPAETAQPATSPASEASAAPEDFAASLREAGFPESYISPLLSLHERYPAWQFRPFFTGVDWNTAVSEESVLGRSLVWSSAASSWKSTQEGAYNWTESTWNELDSGGWVAASRDIVAHYMDPRNSLDESSVFQFLYQGYDAAVQTREGLVTLAEGTFLANGEYDTDLDASNGVTTYLDAIYAAGSAHGVSPYVLASMLIQEMGVTGASQSITGTNSRFPGYYNAFNIGAYKAAGFTAVERGLWYASGGNNGSGTSYGRPWTSLYKAILGGAQFYAANYVSSGQDTLYLKRFNVQGANMYHNQYMTSVAGARSEGQLLSRAYSQAMRAMPLTFRIPVFANMPATACVAPTGDGSPNTRLASLAVSGAVLSPEFHRDTAEYTAIVDNAVEGVTVSAAALYSGAAVSGAGETALSVGVNTVTVSVIAENGGVGTYTLRIVRRSADDGTVTSQPVGTPQPTAAPTTAPTPTPAPTAAPAAARRPGDVNGDGKIQIGDLIRLRNHLLGSAPLTGEELSAADVDKNGAVQINDLIKIRNYLLGTGTLPE